MGGKEDATDFVPQALMVDKGGIQSDNFLNLNGGSIDFWAALLKKQGAHFDQMDDDLSEDLSDDDFDLKEFEITKLPEDSLISNMRLSK